MDASKLHFREILIDILDQLSTNDRKKLSFLLADDIKRPICDDPTIADTLDIFQQLFDRQKISEENFTYLIDAFRRIKCRQAANSLEELQRNLSKRRVTESSRVPLLSTSRTNATATANGSCSFLAECLEDYEDDGLLTRDHSANNMQVPGMDNKSTNVSPAAVVLLTPYKAHRSSVTRKRLISFCVLIFIVISIMTLVIGMIMHLSSSKAQISTTAPLSKASPSPSSSSANTDGIVPTDTNDPRCQLPLEGPCTHNTSLETKTEGLEVFYEEPCSGAGCAYVKPYCRLCWIDPKALGRLDRPQCPSCVSTILNKRS